MEIGKCKMFNNLMTINDNEGLNDRLKLNHNLIIENYGLQIHRRKY